MRAPGLMGADVRPFHGVADIAEQRTTYALRQPVVYPSDTQSLAILSRFVLQAQPMILTVGNVKGGVGKTTLAVNIAISRALAGRDVLLVDGDEQGTAAAFTDLRAERSAPPATPPSSCRARRCGPRCANWPPSTTTW